MKDYDAGKLARAVRTKRWVDNRLTMVQAGKEIGISGKAVCKAENKKGLSKQTFNLICNWLEIPPAEFFKCNEKA